VFPSELTDTMLCECKNPTTKIISDIADKFLIVTIFPPMKVVNNFITSTY